MERPDPALIGDVGFWLASRLGWAIVTIVLFLSVACSTSTPTSSADERLDAADERWAPDLDSDGDADAMLLTGSDVRFAVRESNDLVFVTGEDGEHLVVTIDNRVTVTCASEGALVQTFEPPPDDSPTGPLRLSRLDLEGSTGVLTPSPSFFFGPDFELPNLGQGCTDGS